MSLNARLDRLSLDLHNVSQNQQSSASSTPKPKSKPKSKTSPIVESWEDASLSDSDRDTTKSIPGTDSDGEAPEAPGPSLKSPQTRAVDAERELSGELPDNMPIPPPTPISPQTSHSKADWSPAANLGGGRPIYHSTTGPHSSYSSGSARSTPTGSMTPTHPNRYPTPNPPLDVTSRDRDKDRDADRKRPEKTTATANRLIAGALGIKAPPKTEEQRRYERAVKEQEIKRRNREKEEKKKAEEQDEQARNAIWES